MLAVLGAAYTLRALRYLALSHIDTGILAAQVAYKLINHLTHFGTAARPPFFLEACIM